MYFVTSNLLWTELLHVFIFQNKREEQLLHHLVINLNERLALKNKWKLPALSLRLDAICAIVRGPRVSAMLTASRCNCGGFYAAALQRANTQMDVGVVPVASYAVSILGEKGWWDWADDDGVLTMLSADCWVSCVVHFLSALAGQ